MTCRKNRHDSIWQRFKPDRFTWTNAEVQAHIYFIVTRKYCSRRQRANGLGHCAERMYLASSTDRATTTHRVPTSVRRFANTSNAASLRMALRVPVVMTVDTTTLSPSPARAVGVCPSCNTRRMVETAAHLTDHVFPHLAVRQWVLSVPKRLRYFMQRDGAVLNLVLRIFIRVIEQSLSAHCPGAAQLDKAALHIGAVAFIHRFGSSLNEHVHFHVCVVDGVFEVAAGEADADAQATAPSVIFHPASGIDATTAAQVQADLRRRFLRAFVGRDLIEGVDAKEMLAYKHSGFSVDAGVCIEAHDRAGLERLLRYCARPPFAMDRLRKAGVDLVYRCAKQHSEPTGDKRVGVVAELILTPLELIARIAALGSHRRAPTGSATLACWHRTRHRALR